MKKIIYFVNAYKINLSTEDVYKIELNDNNKQLVIDDLISGIFNKNNYRSYKIKENVSNIVTAKSEVASTVSEISNDKWAENLNAVSENLAFKLKEIEVNRQNEIAKLTGKIKTSTFVHAFIEINDEIKHVLAKFEHKAFLDENDLEEHKGIPVEGTILKSCVFSYNYFQDLIDIRVTDNSKRFATYWWDDFLGLEPIKTDKDNSDLAIDSIHSTIKRSLSNYPEDKMILINRFNGYVKSNQQYNHDEVLSRLFDEYIPINPDAKRKIEKLKEKIEELPLKKGFETSFTIKPETANKKAIDILKVDENINININGGIEDFKDKFDVDMEGLVRVLKIKDIDEETYLKIKKIHESNS
ncbi:hypothetical protein B2H91_06375 [Clostridium botulinum]|uniref:hypothetical protein n=1 Tax=Clostridium botulinum TaxID=1491 RepID=UPI00047124BD|nr:hypothetical protein [Clostridium botulinum]AUN18189.1 hypothetical protein B2M06_11505 [Clostridium botulinum]OSA87841.1 hypothetical protein B2H91_06375 [Clostridium botulinum]